MIMIRMTMRVLPSDAFFSAVTTFLDRNAKFREVFGENGDAASGIRFDNGRNRWMLSRGNLFFEGEVVSEERDVCFVCLSVFYRVSRELRRLQSFFCWVAPDPVPVRMPSPA